MSEYVKDTIINALLFEARELRKTADKIGPIDDVIKRQCEQRIKTINIIIKDIGADIINITSKY